MNSTTRTRLSGESPVFARRRRQLFSGRLRPATFLRAVRRQAAALQNASDADLIALYNDQRTAAGQCRHDQNSVTVMVFALATEALRRQHGVVFHDVQLQAGRALSDGRIAEMQTGEGKTFVAALPAAFFALSRRGVHIATTNSYLAQRDCEITAPVLNRLGITTGLLPEPHDESAAANAYACDVTWGTGHAFGFDYLRDQITLRQHSRPGVGTEVLQKIQGIEHRHRLLQRPPACIVIDEADSVLLDEAGTPLLLSSQPGTCEDTDACLLARDVVTTFVRNTHYSCAVATGNLTVLPAGEDLAMECLQTSGIQSLARPWLSYIGNALHALIRLKRDVDYISQDGKIQIVDQHTGRIAADRHWNNGLHQAVEAKENLTITAVQQTTATVTRQRYIRRYPVICGMTGTAAGSEQEFREVYGLPVEIIPTNLACRRRYEPTRCFATLNAKRNAIADDVRRRVKTGQPVLIGTRTIAESLKISDRLTAAGLTHTVLNGVQDATEADIITQAGQPSRITIATNMAGRGTDIRLTGESRDAGGLHVLATEHHESTRVDRQLIGRCARQGDPGSCQFMISAEDELFVKHANALTRRTIRRMMRRVGQSEECRGQFDAAVRQLQRRLQTHQFGQRKKMTEQGRRTESILRNFLTAEGI